MTLKIATLAAALVLGGAANAAVYKLDGASLVNEGLAFSLTFDDLDNDSLFSMDELLDFDGFNFNGTDYAVVIAAPAIAGFADGGNVDWRKNPAWSFANAGMTSGFSTPAWNWDYTLSAVSAVPLPASALLLLAGLGGLAAMRRKV